MELLGRPRLVNGFAHSKSRINGQASVLSVYYLDHPCKTSGLDWRFACQRRVQI